MKFFLIHFQHYGELLLALDFLELHNISYGCAFFAYS